MEWLDAVKSALQQLVATYEGQAMTLPEYVSLLEETENAGILVAALKSFGFFRQVGKDMFQLDTVKAEARLQDRHTGWPPYATFTLTNWFASFEPQSTCKKGSKQLLQVVETYFPWIKVHEVDGRLKFDSCTMVQAVNLELVDDAGFVVPEVMELLTLIASNVSLEDAFWQLYTNSNQFGSQKALYYMHFSHRVASNLGVQFNTIVMVDLLVYLGRQLSAGEVYSAVGPFARDYCNFTNGDVKKGQVEQMLKEAGLNPKLLQARMKMQFIRDTYLLLCSDGDLKKAVTLSPNQHVPSKDISNARDLDRIITQLDQASVGCAYQGHMYTVELWEVITLLANLTDGPGAQVLTFMRRRTSLNPRAPMDTTWDEAVRYPALTLLDRLSRLLDLYRSLVTGHYGDRSVCIRTCWQEEVSRRNLPSTISLTELRSKFFLALPASDEFFHISMQYCLFKLRDVLRIAREVDSVIDACTLGA
jgi:hypothetical protein